MSFKGRLLVHVLASKWQQHNTRPLLGMAKNMIPSVWFHLWVWAAASTWATDVAQIPHKGIVLLSKINQQNKWKHPQLRKRPCVHQTQNNRLHYLDLVTSRHPRYLSITCLPYGTSSMPYQFWGCDKKGNSGKEDYPQIWLTLDGWISRCACDNRVQR